MASADLRNLHKLHLIDRAILEIRKRAGALDPGRTIQAEIADLTARLEQANEVSKTLSGEQSDLELRQKATNDKVKKIDSDLYGGKIVNPREVENFEKEMASLRQQSSKMDERLLELMDLTPPAKAEVARLQSEIESKKRELAVHQQEAMKLKTKLEEEFKHKAAQRPVAAKDVPPALLARYEAIRKKLNGIGMTELNKNSCASCGTNLPAKIVESAKEGNIVTCESCHRIIYATDGII